MGMGARSKMVLLKSWAFIMISCAGNKGQYSQYKGQQFAKFWLASIRKPCVDTKQLVKPDAARQFLFNSFLLKICLN
jgi:hypothetical protein